MEMHKTPDGSDASLPDVYELEASVATSNLHGSGSQEPLHSDYEQYGAQSPVHGPVEVDWEGPDDPENPRRWSKSRRLICTTLVSCLSLSANLAATMYAPGSVSLAIDFKTRNVTLVAMTVSIYLLGFALGPMIWAPLSEIYGRLPVYHVSNVIYFSFLWGCAFAHNLDQFLLFRFLSGCGASASMTVGGGTIADLLEHPGQDSLALKIFGLGPLLGPVIGPVAGGFVVQTVGWRWTFYVLIIVQGTLTLLCFAFLRETAAPLLLARKAKKLEQETGQAHKAKGANTNVPLTQVLSRGLLRPFKMLLFLPTVSLLSFYNAFVFGLIYLLFTTFPEVYINTYKFTAGVSGLAFLGLGSGMIGGLFLFNVIIQRSTEKKGLTNCAPQPELYLPVMMTFSPCLPIGFFWYGWTAHYEVHWILPILGTVFVGFGAFAVIMATIAYLMTTYGPMAAASALAVNGILRYTFAAFLPLAGPSLYAKLGLGWGNSVLGFICILFIPIPFWFYKYGKWLRERFPMDF
ncbi:MFS general substrate transporter [Massarina eburnea CBS 473.64]|uniref:MFS general substrate transporter n=1 Tax=Massarina eburnea CBS 473.64 TaxID=1395130 RepID=A0A6A6SH32_9PLEO|nr:MFS general substrate transporter [Massarina eburnea CBS 473.64]